MVVACRKYDCCGSDMVVIDDFGGCNMVVPDDSGGCNMVVPDNFGGGNMVVPDDFGGGNMAVPDDFGGGNMVVTFNILTTQWLSLGHESSLSLSESTQCCQFQSRKSPELFKLSLSQNLITKMTYFFASCLSCRAFSEQS